MNLIVQTDGASRGNPGPASYGYVIKEKESGKLVHQEGRKIGIATNNVAEYSAVLSAFQYISDNLVKERPHQIQLVADSLLVVKQLGGLYKIKNPKLKIIFDHIKNLEIDLGRVTYQHVPREKNTAADKLANLALDR
jgi:ribonuclease HI